MANPNGDKGTKWETDVKRFFQQLWPHMIRRGKEGRFDRGEFANGPEMALLECKDWGRLDFPRFLREAGIEAINAGVRFPVAIVKRRKHGVERAYFLMENERGRQLLYEHEMALKILSDMGIDIAGTDDWFEDVA